MSLQKSSKKVCQFNLAWVGRCGKPANASGKCDKHENLLCDKCGKPATRTCSQTMGPMVCGELLCDSCKH